MTPRARWALVWTGWAAYFAAAEYVALRSGIDDAPLSSHLRFVLGARKRSLHTRAGQVAAVAGLVWLADHLYGPETGAGRGDDFGAHPPITNV